MTKRWFLIGVVLFIFLMVAGCGVPQEDHDAVKTELQSVQDELDKAKAELQSVKSQLASVQATVQEQEAKMLKAGSYIESLHYYLYPLRVSNNIPQLLSFESDEEWLAAIDSVVKDTGDSTFETIFIEWSTGEVVASLGFARFLSHMCIMSLRTLD